MTLSIKVFILKSVQIYRWLKFYQIIWYVNSLKFFYIPLNCPQISWSFKCLTFKVLKEKKWLKIQVTQIIGYIISKTY